MNRRSFLKNGAGALVALRYGAHFPESQPQSRAFFIAGSRFCKFNAKIVVGQQVEIVPRTFHGERYFAVNVNGQQVGYVPKRVASALDMARTTASYVTAVSEHAVPWKRYTVTSFFD